MRRDLAVSRAGAGHCNFFEDLVAPHIKTYAPTTEALRRALFSRSFRYLIFRHLCCCTCRSHQRRRSRATPAPFASMMVGEAAFCGANAGEVWQGRWLSVFHLIPATWDNLKCPILLRILPNVDCLPCRLPALGLSHQRKLLTVNLSLLSVPSFSSCLFCLISEARLKPFQFVCVSRCALEMPPSSWLP